MRYYTLPLLVFLSCLFSCAEEPDSPGIFPSSNFIEMEGEGGRELIRFSSGVWHIARVENLSGHARIVGDIYSLDNERINENVALQLEGVGRMEAIWRDKGLTITRNEENLLEVSLNENSTGEQFGFKIILESASGEEEITVSQKPSQGYEFAEIQFAIKEGDGDSLYWRKGTTYQFSVQSGNEVVISPLSGIDVGNSYYFTSEASDAFVWLKDDARYVKLPAQIQGENIYFSDREGLYTEYIQSYESEFASLTTTVSVPSGSSQFYTEYEVVKRVVSYTLLLTNNRTHEVKHIEGRLIQHKATGNYTVKWE